MIPKSMVNSCIGFADMLQLTHLKIQQAIAKAKPDGLIIDVEGLENVQLGNAGELQPLICMISMSRRVSSITGVRIQMEVFRTHQFVRLVIAYEILMS